MSNKTIPFDNILSLESFLPLRQQLRQAHKKVVFTNGVFDLLHRGHVEYLQKAKSLGDVLVVGVNSDGSVRRLKGPQRPIVPEQDRAIIVASLKPVDYVILFSEDTPGKLIQAILPDVLVKGADYQLHEIVGHDVVLQHGGRVERIPLTRGKGTSDLIALILQRYGGQS
ncbi:MAG: D-glycero-beta-D-manno-heptose 1-phosphate adenylyltransferase [Calditrichaeota bacterium]|nr:MAG: D-glycero-beta-D-manno-heptose 1-phosphate adenylyltransferase [Calditrichota bacterium]